LKCKQINFNPIKRLNAFYLIRPDSYFCWGGFLSVVFPKF
jgi:hypothetical protein